MNQISPLFFLVLEETPLKVQQFSISNIFFLVLSVSEIGDVSSDPLP